MLGGSEHGGSMSMVVFPYKADDPDVAVPNLATAASHPRVSRVVTVVAAFTPLLDRAADTAAVVALRANPAVDVIVQDLIRDRRPGKYDRMLTDKRLVL